MRQVVAATRPAKRALFVKVLALFTAVALAAGLTTLPAIADDDAAAPRATSLGGYTTVPKTYLKEVGKKFQGAATPKTNSLGDAAIPGAYTSIVGPYQFNIAGNTNTRGKSDSIIGTQLHSSVDPNAEAEAGYRLEKTTSPVANVGGEKETAPRSNSSSAVLKAPASENVRIHKAYLVVAATHYNQFLSATSPLSTYGVTLKGPRGGMIRCWPEYLFNEGDSRTSTFFDVTDFVKEQSYGIYTGINIPFTARSAAAVAGGDYFGAWKLIVIEENPAVPVRMLRLLLGGTGVVNGATTQVEISGEGLSVADKPTGELVMSMDGSDYMDSAQSMNYTTDQGGSGSISNPHHPQDRFYSFVIDHKGAWVDVDPAPVAGNTSACTSTNRTWPQANTDLCVMDINDDANGGSLKLNGGEKQVIVKASTNNNPTILSSLGLAIDIVVPTFETTMIITNLDRHYSSDTENYNPHVHYAQEGDRLRSTVLAVNKSPEDKKQLGLKNATLTIEVPAMRTVNLDSDVIARYKSYDGKESYDLNVKGLEMVDGVPVITVQATDDTVITRTGFFEVIFEGTAKGSETYVPYSNSASLKGSFVDENGTHHADMVMEKLGLVYKTTASDILRFPVTASSSGSGTLTVTGENGVGDSYPTNGSVTVTPTPDAGHHVQSIVIDGVVRDDLIGKDSFTLPIDGQAHDIRVVYEPDSPNDPPADAEFIRIDTKGDKGVEALTETRTVKRGESMTITWAAKAGYRIHEVLVDGIPYASPASGTLTLSNIAVGHTVEVRTISDYYSIQTIVRGPGEISAGTTVPKGGSYTVNWNVKDAAKDKAELAYVYIDGVKKYDSHAVEHAEGAFETFTFDQVTADHKVEVVYKEFDEKFGTDVPDQPTDDGSFVVATQLVGGPGTISPSVELEKGSASDVDVTWTIGDGFYLDSVILTQGATRTVLTAKDNTVRLQAVSADCTVQVVLKTEAERDEVTYAIDTSMVGGPSSITGSMANLKPHSSGHEVVWKAAEGYRVASVLVDGVPRDDLLSSDRVRFDDIAANHSVIVSVQPLKTLDITGFYSITVTCEGNGTAGRSASVPQNGSHTVSWSPSKGEDVVRVLIDDIEQPGLVSGAAAALASDAGAAAPFSLMNGALPALMRSANSFSFANVGADHRVHVVFSEHTVPADTRFRIDTSIEGGEGTISDASIVDGGDSHTVAWTVGNGSTVAKVYVDGKEVAVPADNRWTFDDVAANHTVRVVLTSTEKPEVKPEAPNGYHSIIIEGSGAGTVGGSAHVPAKGSHTVTWKSSDGSRPQYVIVDGVVRTDLLDKDSLTFSDIAANHTVYVVFEGGSLPEGFDPNGNGSGNGPGGPGEGDSDNGGHGGTGNGDNGGNGGNGGTGGPGGSGSGTGSGDDGGKGVGGAEHSDAENGTNAPFLTRLAQTGDPLVAIATTVGLVGFLAAALLVATWRRRSAGE